MRLAVSLLVVFVVALGTSLPAQTLTQTLPAGFDSGAGGSGSAFPFNNAASHKWQWHYDSAQFTATGPITITEVYIRSLANAAVAAFNFPSVEVVMASSPTSYTLAATATHPAHSLTFAANLNADATTVRAATPWTAAAPPTGWIAMGMTTPFVYDPTLGNDFVVQITKCGSTVAWGANIFGASGAAGVNGGNRYGHQTICTSPTSNFSNNEYVPIVRIDYVLGGGTPEYQVNQGTSYLDINGVVTAGFTPATVNLGIAVVGSLTLSSTLAGAPWELGVGAAPLVPRTGGGLVLADGQILNISLADPTLFLLWGGFLSPPFANQVLPLSFGAPTSLSAQMVVLNPLAPSGLALSQGTRLIVQ